MKEIHHIIFTTPSKKPTQNSIAIYHLIIFWDLLASQKVESVPAPPNYKLSLRV